MLFIGIGGHFERGIAAEAAPTTARATDTIVQYKARIHVCCNPLASWNLCKPLLQPLATKEFVMHAALKYVGAVGSCTALAVSIAVAAGSVETSQDKYNAKVTGGLAFSEFKGYESWEAVSISQDGKVIALIVANPVMISAYKAGIPTNGKPFPDGSKMAKIHWTPKTSETFPAATVPGALVNVDFMERDSKRFADSGGWGWAVFDYDAASDKFIPGTTAGTPPQANDAKCGFACHTLVKTRDYVFTEYGKR